MTEYEYGTDAALKSTITKKYYYYDFSTALTNFDLEKGYGESDPYSTVMKDYSISSSEEYPQNAEEGKVYYDENGLPTYKIMIPTSETYLYSYASSGHIASIDMLMLSD